MNTSYREWYGVFPFMENTKTLDEGAKKCKKLAYPCTDSKRYFIIIFEVCGLESYTIP